MAAKGYATGRMPSSSTKDQLPNSTALTKPRYRFSPSNLGFVFQEEIRKPST
ncbi:hypothetical protein D3C72_2383390 [compost metagenome]